VWSNSSIIITNQPKNYVLSNGGGGLFQCSSCEYARSSKISQWNSYELQWHDSDPLLAPPSSHTEFKNNCLPVTDSAKNTTLCSSLHVVTTTARLTALYAGQPRWGGTGKTFTHSHPGLVAIIQHIQLPFSIFYGPQHLCRIRQSFSTTSLQAFFGLPLGPMPSNSTSMHFFHPIILVLSSHLILPWSTARLRSRCNHYASSPMSILTALSLSHTGLPREQNYYYTTSVWRPLFQHNLAGWPQSSRKKFPEFSRLFLSHKYTFPEVIATIFFGNLAAFTAIFNHIFTVHARNGYFSWHLLDRVTSPRDHNNIHLYFTKEAALLTVSKK